jgi:ssDNA-binding replication factor A large subunit
MSLSREEIYNALVNSGLSKEEIEQELKKMENKYQDIVSENGMLFMIAKEKDLPIIQELYKELENEIDHDEFAISISEVREGMSNIVLLGKIQYIIKPREFVHKDGTPGKVGSFLLNDGTGGIKIVQWGEQTTVMTREFFKINELIRIIGGYAKKSRDGDIDVYLSKKGRVILAPNDVELRRFPLLQGLQFSESDDKDLLNIPDKEEGFISIIEGTVVKIEQFEEKVLKNGEMTFLLRFLLACESSTILVVVWGMQAVECLKFIEEGISIKLMNIITKFNEYSHQEEVHFTKNTKIEVL